MKLKLDLNKENLSESLKLDKQALIPVVVLLISAVLFIIFILPSLLFFFSKKSARDVEIAKLNEMETAKDILDSVNEEVLDSEVEIVSQALPSEKNFELILGAINEAATNSNVLISGYKFNDSGGVENSEAGSGFPSLLFEISIAGNIDQAASFANELYKTYPISSVKSISYINEVSTLNVEFYYNPFVSLNSENTAVIRAKTAKELSTLSEISRWNQVSTDLQFSQLEPATGSAEENVEDIQEDDEELSPTFQP